MPSCGSFELRGIADNFFSGPACEMIRAGWSTALEPLLSSNHEADIAYTYAMS
jgi:hypothetical protein